MNRRDFALKTSLLALSATALPARAQAALVEGTDYKRVAQPVPVSGDKIEVVEFFGYWCPHCNAFEPALDAWAKKLPVNVSFKRWPVAFNAAQEPAQRLYFAIEALGLLDTLHRKVFAAMHVEQKRLDKDAEISEFASKNGVDPAKLMDAMKSFSVATKIRQSRQLSEGYRIEGVPTLGVHGRFMTSPSIAGSQERALAVADALILQARKA